MSGFGAARDEPGDLAGGVGDRPAGRIDFPDPSPPRERLHEDEVGRLGDHVLLPLRRRPAAVATEPNRQLEGMAAQHDHIPDRKEVGEMAYEDRGKRTRTTRPVRAGERRKADHVLPARTAAGAHA